MPSQTPESVLFMWEAEYPRQVAAMKKAGTLADEVDAAVEIAGDVYGQAIEDGLNPDQAWELEREAVRDLPAAW